MAKVQVDSNGKIYCDSNNKILVTGGYTEIPKYIVQNGVVYRNQMNLTGQFGGITDIAERGFEYCFNSYSFTGDLSFPDLTTIGLNGMNYSFNGSMIRSVSFPELTSVGQTALQYAFYNCKSLMTISFPKLEQVESSGMARTFQTCSSIGTASFPELTTVKDTGLGYCFSGCHLLETVTFSKLVNLQYTTIFTNAFQECKGLKDIYFPALKTTSFGSLINQFNSMFNSGTNGTAVNSGNVNVHFPSNLSTTISGLTGYPLFGGTSGRITLLYDLPQTS